MTGKYLSNRSWEKQQLYRLDNGMVVTVEWNQCYGEFVKRIDDPEGYWCASSGTDAMPERFHFLLDWQEVVVKSCDQKLIRPKFEKR